MGVTQLNFKDIIGIIIQRTKKHLTVYDLDINQEISTTNYFDCLPILLKLQKYVPKCGHCDF